MNRSLCKDPKTLASQELDERIELATTDGDLNTLALYVPHRLSRHGQVSSAILLLMARDLYLLYKYGLWKEYDYTSFPEWVAAEFTPEPYGRDYSTVMALIRVWQFWHIMAKWPIEMMATAGKAKLELFLATAQSSTKRGTQPIDEDVVAVLLDTDTPHLRAMDAYNARKALKAEKQRVAGREELAIALPQNRHVSYTADSTTGILHAWLPITEPNGSAVSVKLGRLDFGIEQASPWLHILLSRAKVKIT